MHDPLDDDIYNVSVRGKWWKQWMCEITEHWWHYTFVLGRRRCQWCQRVEWRDQ